jgi:hypothetical protein
VFFLLEAEAQPTSGNDEAPVSMNIEALRAVPTLRSGRCLERVFRELGVMRQHERSDDDLLAPELNALFPQSLATLAAL